MELEMKLGTIRAALAATGLAAVRLRGVDWFAWATGGGSSAVLLAAESGVGEVFVTAEGAWVLTDTIEQERLRAEEAPAGLEVWYAPWNEPAARAAFVAERVGEGRIASDWPWAGEEPLPPELVAAKRRLTPEEIERYRGLGADAATAMTDALARARPEWTEWQLAGAGAEAL